MLDKLRTTLWGLRKWVTHPPWEYYLLIKSPHDEWSVNTFLDLVQDKTHPCRQRVLDMVSRADIAKLISAAGLSKIAEPMLNTGHPRITKYILEDIEDYGEVEVDRWHPGTSAQFEVKVTTGDEVLRIKMDILDGKEVWFGEGPSAFCARRGTADILYRHMKELAIPGTSIYWPSMRDILGDCKPDSNVAIADNELVLRARDIDDEDYRVVINDEVVWDRHLTTKGYRLIVKKEYLNNKFSNLNGRLTLTITHQGVSILVFKNPDGTLEI